MNKLELYHLFWKYVSFYLMEFLLIDNNSFILNNSSQIKKYSEWFVYKL